MIITNCPRCGSMNITTAGGCANCGWSQFTKSTVSTGVLLDDYKRLLLENNSLTVRIAELETKIRHNALWQASEDAEERAHLEKLVLDLKKRIAELEAAHRWRVVADGELPNKNDYYLARDDLGQQGMILFYDGEWNKFTNLSYVTLWMPLPELPKERER